MFCGQGKYYRRYGHFYTKGNLRMICFAGKENIIGVMESFYTKVNGEIICITDKENITVKMGVFNIKDNG